MEQGGGTLREVFEEMPLRVLFALEHCYHIKNGRKCEVMMLHESLEMRMSEL